MAANDVVDLTLDDDDDDYVAPERAARQQSRRRPLAHGGSPHAAQPPPPPSASQAKKDEATECSICFDQMRESGDHRPCCLTCGHIFGQKCLSEWIEKKSWCPSCQKPSRRGDIRVLFGLPVLGADEQELQKVTAQLEEEKQKRHKAEVTVERLKSEAKQRSEEHVRDRRRWEQEVERLRAQIATLQSGRQPQQHGTPSALSATGQQPSAPSSQRAFGLASPVNNHPAFAGGSPLTLVGSRSSKRKRSTKN